jgi:hypothetical protein
MGFVYSLQDFVQGRIPTRSDYDVAMESLRYGLNNLYESGQIYGANIHGSNFNKGEAVLGSDIDVLVMLDRGDCAAVEGNLQRIQESIMRNSHVFAEFAPVQKVYAEKGWHTLDYFYLKYIGDFCKSGIIGNPTVPLIMENLKTDRAEEIKRISVMRLHRLSKDRSMMKADFGDNHCKSLERYMRQTIHAAIDVLKLMSGGYPERDGRPLCKQEICDLYARAVGVDTEDLMAALKMTKKYRKFLASNSGKASDYKDLLSEIDSMYPNARRFMESTIDYVHQNF